ncbi:hypothetical protein KSP40_PGU012630 [Platanthera guangdongensis]|uniref:Uncharacterized protein n=1 Tax=Platanthera guangdongensis TaxID=2320717 RepID=A0ABR2LEK2_9ASPA
MLRVLYNKHLHWRHANARANAALQTQRVSAEKARAMMFWRTDGLVVCIVIQRTDELSCGQLTLADWFQQCGGLRPDGLKIIETASLIGRGGPFYPQLRTNGRESEASADRGSMVL